LTVFWIPSPIMLATPLGKTLIIRNGPVYFGTNFLLWWGLVTRTSKRTLSPGRKSNTLALLSYWILNLFLDSCRLSLTNINAVLNWSNSWALYVFGEIILLSCLSKITSINSVGSLPWAKKNGVSFVEPSQKYSVCFKCTNNVFLICITKGMINTLIWPIYTLIVYDFLAIL